MYICISLVRDEKQEVTKLTTIHEQIFQFIANILAENKTLPNTILVRIHYEWKCKINP